ncbi:L-xylulose reductase [Frankliniella fusca]|uniref:L-xylulose reductase n=1 Tax=Frankliniella fusca TaxID=407009 RepID=A0AAE1H9I2_9NEOP|nr:L-xylulose reductase [Frankliniella fusca]
MGIYCEHCKAHVRGGLSQFQTHLKIFKHGPLFYCSEGACDKRCYVVKSSFIRHFLDSHNSTCLSDEEETSSSQTTASSQESCSQSSSSVQSRHSSQSFEEAENNVSAHTSNSQSGEETRNAPSSELSRNSSNVEESSDTEESGLDNELQNSAARMVLNLRRTGNVTETAMKKFMEETQKLSEQSAKSMRQQVVDNLTSAGVNEDTIRKSVDIGVTQPFKKLKNCQQQMKYFEENFHLVQPESKQFGDRYDERLDKETGNALPVQVPVKFQYISVKKTLTAVLNNKVLFDLIHSETAGTDGKMRSFLDGSLAGEHPLIKEHPHALRLVLYIDDFECANPLGSKAGPHKITAVYLLIQNLPPEENARLRSIHLSAHAYREDLPLDKLVDVLLEPFFDELKSLETEAGVTILVNKEDFTLRATLIALAADTLGAHEVLGLFSSSAEHFCSHCLISKAELHQDILAIGEMRSKVTHLDHLREIQTRGPLFVQREYGVKRYSLFVHESKFTPFPDIFVKDGLHDLLKGIAPMELKL